MSEPYVVGDLHCQAAVFCYKGDNTVEPLKSDLDKIAGDPPMIRGEIHEEKKRFLKTLREWNEHSDPRGTFLCIYAHSGEPGIAPIGGKQLELHPDPESLIITWEELAHAMPKGVAYLWLLGCRTQEVLKIWQELGGPVFSRLLATDAKDKWRPFVKWFAAEISLDPVFYNDEMIPLLIRKAPDLAKHTQYFGPDFKPVVPPSSGQNAGAN
ncbi:MAG: hypothetical protein WA324_10370 [Bryobacteraceae bacterium]